MNSRSLKLMICGAFFAGVICSAQKPDTTRLINSMEGPALYKAYCATCHGTDGKGIGPMTESLKVKTPDLTRISIREGSKFPLARVQKIISGEESLAAGHGTRDMPVWGPIFSQVSRDQDLGRMRVYNLAKFIEKMQGEGVDRKSH